MTPNSGVFFSGATHPRPRFFFPLLLGLPAFFSAGPPREEAPRELGATDRHGISAPPPLK